MAKCLYCYKELPEGVKDFHPACARKIFGEKEAPVLPYTRDNLQELAVEVVSRSTAVTGVQPKLSLDIHKDSKHDAGRFTIVGLWGRYILKPQTDLYPNLPELEDLTMHMAEAAKIATVPHSLIRFADGELCYITRRIDRTDDGGKLPMEDMCQLTEHLTEQKYNGSHEQIAKAIRRFSSSPLLDLVNYWEQVVFSWVAGNSDMHLKNFSLYLPVAGQIILTPAYDMLSTLSVMPEDNEELALTVNGRKNKITRADFQKAMTSSGLPEKTIANIFKKMHRGEPAWQQWIDESFLPPELRDRLRTILANRLSRLSV